MIEWLKGLGYFLGFCFLAGIGIGIVIIVLVSFLVLIKGVFL
uniref:Uncharacterized protein n=1 Tax=Siphoviridae sp. ctZHD14 TaxID=2827891 RepID=A0A8S5SXL6_9CAUD|nr:MAG TPA: hypothetical protein [Siphoviridae sp. ctZHD14]